VGVRVPSRSPAREARGGRRRCFQRSPTMMKVWTRIRATRRVRWRRRLRRLLPPVARSDGWRRYGGGELQVSVDELV
jgi:hypothetical protein